MTALAPERLPIDRRPPRRFNRATILLLGVALAPIIVAFAAFPGGPLTEETALRMAFGAVAGKTIAVLSAAAALLITVRRDRRLVSVLFFSMLFLLVFSWSIASMTNDGVLLLDRLDHIAEVELLNE
ncbi:hypothetical protein ACFXP7_06050 [Microbacterium sp. P06]|uniref:hypothetical protein n=1 Tax=Microbacterium sp. P06 TaxID=3366949 RepID=UPI003745CC3B